MEPGNPYNNKLKPFYVYAQESKKDVFLVNELKKHLRWLPFEEDDNDLDVLPGKDRKKELTARFETADIIFLLISSDFYSSQECRVFEELTSAQQITTISILLRPMITRPVHTRTIASHSIIALPEYEKALTLNPRRRDDELKKITERIWQEVDTILLPRYIQTAKNQLNEKQYDQVRLTCHDARSQVYGHPILHTEHYSDFYKQMGDIYYKIEDFKDANKCYHEACLLDKRNPALFIASGDALSQLDQIPEAIQAYQKALEIANDLHLLQEKATIHEKIGDAHSKYKQYHEALKAYNESLQISPLNRELLIKCTKAQLAIAVIHQTTGINTYYDTALNLKPEKPYLFLRDKGNVLYDFELYGDALDAYNKALEAYNKASTDTEPYKEIPYLYKEKGDTLFQLKHFLEALETYEMAVSLQPDLLLVIKEKKDVLLETIEEQRNVFSICLEKYQKP